MTTGSEWKHVVLFSLPIMAGNLLQQLYNTVDGIVVGNFVSEDALAAVGTCATLSMLFLAVAMGMSNGAGIMVSQFFGARRIGELRKSVSTAILLNAGLGVAMTLLGVLGARLLLGGLLGVKDPAILDMAVTYFVLYSAGLIFQFVYNIIAAVLRAVGDSRATLYFLCVAAVLNLILDLVFVIVFHWGVAGAAIATSVSQLICAAVSAVYMVKKHELFRFGRGEFVFDSAKCATCLRLGVPTTLQQCVVGFGHVFIQRLVNGFGAVSMAAFTVGNRLENYVLIPIFGLNIGLSTFTGQNVGAGRFERVSRGLKRVVLISVVTCAAISALTYVFAEPLAALFGVSGETEARAVEQMRYMCLFLPMFALYMPASGMLQGAGDVVFSSLCTIATLVVRVAAAYLLHGVFHWGYAVAWQTMPLGWVAALIIAYSRFFSGKWKTKGIVKQQPVQE